MRYIQKKYYTLLALLGLLTSVPTLGQVCNFTENQVIRYALTGGSTGLGIESKLVLATTNGTIVAVSTPNTLEINAPVAGQYQLVGVTYPVAQTPPLSVGGTLASVDSCFKTPAEIIQVCGCNSTGVDIQVATTSQSTVAGQVNQFILTDGAGRILAINTTGTFPPQSNGAYNVYGISFDVSGVMGLTVGGSISAISGACFDLTEPIGFAVCQPDLVVTKQGPTIGQTGQPYDYTLSIRNQGLGASNGTITVSDTLQTGLQFVSGIGNDWACSLTASIVTCTTTQTIATNGVSNIVIQVVPQTAGVYLNRAAVRGGGDETLALSNQVTTQVGGEDCVPICVPITIQRVTTTSP
ncbi:MAG: hypothetical protein ACK4UP_03640 [Spirosomataceae bacterium]